MDNDLILQPLDDNEHTPSRADAVHNREKLLQTARRLFSDEGVGNVSMTLIAQEANVGKGTLYRHFANKVELCQALLDDTQRELQEQTLSHLRQEASPHDKLQWFLAEVARYVYDNTDLLRAHSGAFDASHLSHSAHWWWRNTIHSLLAECGVTGDLDYITDVLYVMLDVVTIHYQTTTLGYDLSRIVDGLTLTLNRFTA